MTDWGSDLGGAVRFEKNGDFCSCQMRTIVMKDVKEKSKNRNKKVKPKIMNCFLIRIFVPSCLDKTREIVHYH